MRDFTIRLLSFVAIVAIIIGYNVTLELRAKDEQIAQLTADLEASQSAGKRLSCAAAMSSRSRRPSRPATGSLRMRSPADSTGRKRSSGRPMPRQMPSGERRRRISGGIRERLWMKPKARSPAWPWRSPARW